MMMMMMGRGGEQEMKNLGWEIEKKDKGIRCSFRGELSRILGFGHPPLCCQKRAAKKGGRCRKHRWWRGRHKGWDPSSKETHSERHIISERANVQIAREEVLTGEIESGVSKPEIKVVERELAALENSYAKGSSESRYPSSKHTP